MYLDFIEAKNDYISASVRAFACGLAAANGGNISIRVPHDEKMIVKPTGITLGQACEENLIVTDLSGNLLEGSLKPTKETLMHGGLYRKLPNLGGICHVHPVYSIMVANCYDEMPLVTKQMKQITDSPVKVCKIKNNTVNAEGMEMIYSLLDSQPGICCFLLEEHGVVALGKSATDAENIAELVEENARVFWEMESHR